MCITIFVLIILVGAFLIAKNDNTFENHNIIIDAIYDYIMTQLDEAKSEEDLANIARNMLENMESYDRTFWRLYDWSYKRIVPESTFELIKPYIKEKEG